MSIRRTVFENYLKEFQFKELFNELGWDYVRKYPDLVNSVTVKDIKDVANKHLHLDRMHMAVAGPVDLSGKVLPQALEEDE